MEPGTSPEDGTIFDMLHFRGRKEVPVASC